MKNINKKTFLTSSIVAVMILVPIASASAAWTGPTGTPPTNNTPAPLNVSTTNQTKTGGILSVYDLWANDSIAATVAITAPQFCIGASCISSWAGTSQWTTTGSTISYTTGSVGIGTVSPGDYGARLQVVGVGGQATILPTNINWNPGASTGTGLAIGFPATTGNTDARLQSLVSGGASAGVLSLNPLGGNVGIGLANPTQKLDVAGQIQSSGNPTGTSIIAAGSNGNPYASMFADTNSGAAGFGFNLYYNGTSWVYANTGAWGGKGLAWRMYPGSFASLSYAANGANPATFTDLLTIKMPSGNLGIGNNAPYSKLSNTSNNLVGHDWGTAMGGITWEVPTLDAGFAMGLQNDNTTVNGAGLLINNASVFAAAPILEADSGGFSRLYVAGNGNVGIGTSTPGQKLDVNGVIQGNNELISSSITGFSNIRMIGGLYGAMWRNDGTDTYFLLTPSGAQTGAWNTLRPFSINDVTGNVSMAQAQVTIAHGTGSVTANSFLYNSDERLKKNIAPLLGNLQKVLQLEPVSYLWKDPKKSPDNQIGFIAQQVEKIVPELVYTNASTSMKSVDYIRTTPLLVGAVQELNQKITTQQKEINELKTVIIQLQAKAK